MTGFSICNNFEGTTGFYWRYMLLLKPPVLRCSVYLSTLHTHSPLMRPCFSSIPRGRLLHCVSTTFLPSPSLFARTPQVTLRWWSSVSWFWMIFLLPTPDRPRPWVEVHWPTYCVVYCSVLWCTVMYCSLLWCTIVYCDVLQFTVMYCSVLWCTVVYCDVL